MQPRSDGQAFTQEAIVTEHLCVSCGICVGACPTATPFRRGSELVPGIDLPHRSMRELREKILEVTAGLEGPDRVLVYGCDHGPDLSALERDGVAVLRLACTAMLPPGFLDFVISRRLADGVFLTGCREGKCYHRLGIEWMEARIERRRDPYLRQRVPRERIGRFWAGASRGQKLMEEVRVFRERLKTLAPYTRTSTGQEKEMAGHG
jgi:coenzyme F420-reducing hydrogenase delta subunit